MSLVIDLSVLGMEMWRWEEVINEVEKEEKEEKEEKGSIDECSL